MYGSPCLEQRANLSTFVVLWLVYIWQDGIVSGAVFLDAELRKIAHMSEDNLRLDPTSVGDLRHWFQSMRRLPEFNYYEAIDRLQAWATRTEAVDACYYLYILHFLRWKDKNEDAEKTVMQYIDASTQRRVGIRGYSFEWLGFEPKWCPLIDASELGAMDRQKGFFADAHRLAYATGTIESVRPQSGTIRLGRLLRAFFVPPPDIREASHINADVHFHLGFSYEGFRAWNVRLGPPPAGPGPSVPIKLWVNGLPSQFTEDDVRALFQPFGRVKKVEMPRDHLTKGNRGFAFVFMANLRMMLHQPWQH